MSREKAFTLTEVMLALLILTMSLAGILGATVFFLQQIKAVMERADFHAQVNYAMEDMQLHFMSAIRVTPSLVAGAAAQPSLSVWGESNVYNVTLNNTTDNRTYSYVVRDPCLVGGAAGTGCLVRRTFTTNVFPPAGAFADEVLISQRFTPQIAFQYMNTDGPNIVRVTISGNFRTAALGLPNPLQRQDAIRFWFINVAP